MDDEAIQAVTRALDNAIVSVASRQFNTLTTGLNHQQIVESIRDTLRSLQGLQGGRMPDYDAWDALFYSFWFQPVQINLAYTLTRLLPEEINPLKSRGGDLQVVDFGCGALAMQFGLALAVADTLEERGTVPSIAIMSQDASKPMKDIGWNIWQCFIEEIVNYPELNSLLQVCQTMRFDDQGDPEAVCWLTALHVAYRENAGEVRTALASHIDEHKPALILVTCHPQSAQWAFSPTDLGYTDSSDVFSGTEFVLDGEFEEVTKFRSDLYNNHIANMVDFLGEDDYWFVRNYLTRYPTAWVTTDDFRTRDFLYVRD